MSGENPEQTTGEPLPYKEQKRRDRENKIIRTAQTLFAHHGWDKTSMEEVAAAVPLAKATLYRHFRNKEELLRAVVRLEIGQFQQKLKQVLETHQNPLNRLIAYSQERLVALRNMANFYQLTEEPSESISDPLTSELSRYYHLERKIVRQILEDGIAQGLFKEVPLDDLAEVITMSIKGLEMAWSFSGDQPPPDIEEVKSRSRKLFLLLYEGIGRHRQK